MKKQKDAVVEEVKNILGSKFTPYQDNALSLLSADELEFLKNRVTNLISVGAVAYSKDASLFHEVQTYARSMVMNHLKKAKELTGGVQSPNVPKKAKEPVNQINEDILPDSLKEFVRTL